MASSVLSFTLLGNDAGASRAIARVGAAAEATGKQAATAADRQAAAMARMQKAADLAGKVFAGAAIAIGVAGVNAAVQFEQAMARINTQAGVSTKGVAALSKQVLQLAPQVGTGPTQLAAALYHVESAFQSTGITGSKAMSILKIAAEGAKVGGSDLVDTTNALDAAIVSNIPGVKNFQQAMGALNATVGVGDMTMQDLSEAFGTGAVAVVKNYGLSLTDVSAALAVFGDNNIRGAQAGTALRMSVQSLAVPTKIGTSWLKGLGITSGQLAKDMEHGGLNDAMKDLVGHMTDAGITGSKVGDFLTTTFGKRAGVGLGILVSQMGRFESKFGDIKKASGDFATSWANQEKTAKQKLDDLRAAWDVFLIKIGNAILPDLKAIATWLSKHVGLLTDSAKYVAIFAGAWALVKFGNIIGGLLNMSKAILGVGAASTTAAAESDAAALGAGAAGSGAGVATGAGAGLAARLVIPVAIAYTAVEAGGMGKSLDDIVHGQFQQVTMDAPGWAKTIAGTVSSWFGRSLNPTTLLSNAQKGPFDEVSAKYGVSAGKAFAAALVTEKGGVAAAWNDVYSGINGADPTLFGNKGSEAGKLFWKHFSAPDGNPIGDNTNLIAAGIGADAGKVADINSKLLAAANKGDFGSAYVKGLESQKAGLLAKITSLADAQGEATGKAQVAAYLKALAANRTNPAKTRAQNAGTAASRGGVGAAPSAVDLYLTAIANQHKAEDAFATIFPLAGLDTIKKYTANLASFGSQVSDTGKSLVGNSSDAVQNRAALTKLILSAKAGAEAAKDQTGKQTDYTAALKLALPQIDAAAAKTGLNKQQVIELEQKLGILPPNKAVPVTTPGSVEANAQVAAFLNSLQQLQALKTIQVNVAAAFSGPGGDVSGLNLEPGAVQPRANGGISPHGKPGGIYQWAEAGGEAFIPLAQSKRSRSLALWAQTGKMLGVHGMADGGLVLNMSSSGSDGAFAGITSSLQSAAANAAVKAAASFSGSIGGGVAQWVPLILQVMGQLGLPARLLPRIEAQMSLESGGNPNAINLSDTNAQKGDPSKGLMQTVSETFAAYAGPYAGLGIYNPLANIYAGLNYAMHRYAGDPNIGLGYGHGYANGTSSAAAGWHKVGERGAEWVNFRGREQVLPHGVSPGGVTVNLTLQAWDGPSVDRWLFNGGAKKIQIAVAKSGGNGLTLNRR